MYAKELCMSLLILGELIWIVVEFATDKSIGTLNSKLINKTYIVETEHCKIPDLDPFDPTIVDYYYKKKYFDCYNGQLELINTDHSRIYVNMITLRKNKLELKSLDCCYMSYLKAFPEKAAETVYNNTCSHFTSKATVHDEFILVRCAYAAKIIYQNLFSFIPLKNVETVKHKMNVIILGFGGLSRMNFHRHMPETLDTMRDIGGIEMFGYNKVGLDSLSNISPLLTGLTENDLQASNSTNYIDHLPFIWNDFRNAGYVTCYMEDTYYQATFDYPNGMFFKQPTDYYWRPCSRLLPVRFNMQSAPNCIFGKRVVDLMIDYFDRFTEQMRVNEKSHFTYFWSETQTRDLNTAWMIDQNISSSINNLRVSGALNNTALFLLSDHGHRSDGILRTYQGGLEDRLPLLYIYLPRWFREKYPVSLSYLQEKAHHLTTPYDVHKTLFDLANIDIPQFSHEELGLSLLDPPDENRTCDSAGVPLEFCGCYVGDDLLVGLQEVEEAADTVVLQINEKLDNTSCYEVSLHRVVRSHRINVPRNCTCDYTMDFVIVLETLPEYVLFEASIQHKMIDNERKYNVTSAIRRDNFNGKVRSCVPEHLQQYCVCKKLY